MNHLNARSTILINICLGSLALASCGQQHQGDMATPNSFTAPRTKAIGSSHNTSSPVKANAAVTRVLARHFKANGPGAAVLVSENGKVQVEQCYGLANIAQKTPITLDSVFDLASLSKEFTATAALLLISQGKLSLNEPVVRAVPEFRVPIKGRAITVGDLIYHLSGLADYTDDWDGSDESFDRLTTETHLKWLNGTKARRAPGRKWEYNNSEYALLALVIERTSGMPLSQFLQTRLFRPAGMTHTFVHDRLALHRSIPSLVTGYKNEKGKVSRSSEWTQTVGDGNVLTTIEDMAKWDRALRGNTILTDKQKKLAWSSGRLDSGQKIEDEGTGYGFGWNTDEANQDIFHTGSWMGTSTYIVRYLNDSGRTVVVLSNDENAEAADIGTEIENALDQ